MGVSLVDSSRALGGARRRSGGVCLETQRAKQVLDCCSAESVRLPSDDDRNAGEFSGFPYCSIGGVVTDLELLCESGERHGGGLGYLSVHQHNVQYRRL